MLDVRIKINWSSQKNEFNSNHVFYLETHNTNFKCWHEVLFLFLKRFQSFAQLLQALYFTHPYKIKSSLKGLWSEVVLWHWRLE